MLDYEILKQAKGDTLTAIAADDIDELFKSCEPGCHPALAEAFGLSGVVDPSIFSSEDIYIESGISNHMIHLTKEEAYKIFDSYETRTFAIAPEQLLSSEQVPVEETVTIKHFTPKRIKQRIDETFDLPAMPDIAQEIMKLRVDPGADAKKLGEIVGKDPSLSAQIISWASSPYYGYKGTVDSVETATSRVLGYDLVMNLALGISIGKSLNVQESGPLGLRNFWQQSVYCASLVEKLCLMIPPKQRPERGLAYLSGLLHRFGHLLLGHLFPPQFASINRYVEVNPSIMVEDIENHVLGVTHEEIGAWLMKNWHMPDELIVAVRWYNTESVASQHAVYSSLVLLANCLLKRIQQRGSEIHLPHSTLEQLSLDEASVNESFEQLLEEQESLDLISKQLVA